ncbi:MAG: 50S ribosomal protein L30 [Spirochaetia bacterium]|jgi:large subunit ribosomal protein L30|nr:50S ribosomal protein L30 [Spirochaetia bacterium]
MSDKKEKKVRIELVRSMIRSKPKQRGTVKALGLGKIGSSVEREATPVVLGMINTISHLVKVEEIE